MQKKDRSERMWACGDVNCRFSLRELRERLLERGGQFEAAVKAMCRNAQGGYNDTKLGPYVQRALRLEVNDEHFLQYKLADGTKSSIVCGRKRGAGPTAEAAAVAGPAADPQAHVSSASASAAGSSSDVTVGLPNTDGDHGVATDHGVDVDLRVRLASKLAELGRVRSEYRALREQLQSGRETASRCTPHEPRRVPKRARGELIGRIVAAPEWCCPDAGTPVEGEVVAELHDLGRAVVRWPEREMEYTHDELESMLRQRKRKPIATPASRVGPKYQARLPSLIGKTN